MNLLENLTPQQKAIVLHKDHILVSACPGSGKTHTLLYKIAYFLQQQEDFDKRKAAALTYTNRAAEEISHRIETLDINTDNLWSGTIHSFCMQWILRPYSGYVGSICEPLKYGFTIIDPPLAEDKLSQLKQQKSIKPYTEITTRLNISGKPVETNQLHKGIVNKFYKDIVACQEINFDLILYLSYKLIITYPFIAKAISNVFNLICIDEYQDTQELQYAILHLIALKEHTHLCYLGDPNQAIFESLGGIAKTKADVEIELGQPITELPLSDNRRSTQRLINFYSHFQVVSQSITACVENLKKESGIITYESTIHKDTTIDYIANIIIQAIQVLKIPSNDICIVAPSWYHIIPFGRKLRGVLPDEIDLDSPGLSPLSKSRENIWFKVARLILVPPHPKRFLRRCRWAKELINDLENITNNSLSYTAKELLELINTLENQETDGLTYLRNCFKQFMIALNINLDNEQLNKDYDSLFASAERRRNHADYNVGTDINSFRKMFEDQNGITIETIHGVKGEEYQLVIALGLLHGKVPNWGNNTPITSKRLLYVLASRAKRYLHLISETGYSTKGGSTYNPTKELEIVKHFQYDKT